MPYTLDEFADFAVRASEVIKAMDRKIKELEAENQNLKGEKPKMEKSK